MKVIEKLPETLVIDRSRWARGKRTHDNLLLNTTDGSMCCLGFLARECGLSTLDIAMRASPASLCWGEVARIAPLVMPDGHGGTSNSTAAASLMQTNDRAGDTDAEREAQVTRELASLGVTVTFIDGPTEEAPNGR